MGANISFDAEKLIGRLNLLEKSLIPQARHRALHDLGQYLRKFHAREMESVFNEPRKYTTSSVLYKVQGDTLTLFIRDDSRQSPARYLEPQTMSPGQYLKSALVTGFSGHLRRGIECWPWELTRRVLVVARTTTTDADPIWG